MTLPLATGLKEGLASPLLEGDDEDPVPFDLETGKMDEPKERKAAKLLPTILEKPVSGKDM